MLSVADRRPCLLLFDLDLFNDVPHGAIVVSATQGNSVIVRGPGFWSRKKEEESDMVHLWRKERERVSQVLR